MKRKNASLLGNVLMGLGLVVMVVGVGYSILNQLPQFNMPQYFARMNSRNGAKRSPNGQIPDTRTRK